MQGGADPAPPARRDHAKLDELEVAAHPGSGELVAQRIRDTVGPVLPALADVSVREADDGLSIGRAVDRDVEPERVPRAVSIERRVAPLPLARIVGEHLVVDRPDLARALQRLIR